MRPVREVSSEEENFRMQEVGDGISMIKRDPVEPEPIGTLIMVPFRITGYHPDCDGSLLARLEAINKDAEATGFETNCHGLYSSCDLVITKEELKQLYG